jgi:hypothetical protein
LPYASAPLVCRAADRSQAEARPAIRFKRSGRCRVHRIPTHVRDDRDTPLLAGRNGLTCRTDLGAARRSIFLKRELDGANHVDWVEEIRANAHRRTRFRSPPAIVHRKNALGQPNCIFRLGRACSLRRNSSLVCGAKKLSQFSFMLLLVTSLMLTVCVGVAAWRMSDDLPEVTGSTSSESIHVR